MRKASLAVVLVLVFLMAQPWSTRAEESDPAKSAAGVNIGPTPTLGAFAPIKNLVNARFSNYFNWLSHCKMSPSAECIFRQTRDGKVTRIVIYTLDDYGCDDPIPLSNPVYELPVRGPSSEQLDDFTRRYNHLPDNSLLTMSQLCEGLSLYGDSAAIARLPIACEETSVLVCK